MNNSQKRAVILASVTWISLWGSPDLFAQSKPVSLPGPVTIAKDPANGVGAHLERIRRDAHTLIALSATTKTEERNHVFNKNPIVVPNESSRANLMAQYDGFRFIAPYLADVYIQVIVPHQMASHPSDRSFSWDIYSKEALPLEPARPFWFSFHLKPKDLKSGKFGSYVVPEDGARGVSLRIPTEALHSGKEYLFVLKMPGDGNNFNKDEYSGHISIRAVGPSTISDLMYQELQ